MFHINWQKPFIYLVLSGVLIVSMTLYSCKSNTVSPVSQTGSVSLKVNNNASYNSNNTIALDSAKILLMDVQFVSGNDTSVIKTGPMVIHINLTGVLTVVATNNIKAATYPEVLFKIHKHVPNEPINDTDFGTSVGYSTVIGGKFNGVNFIYRSAITAVQNLTLSNHPIVVPANTNVAVNVTIEVNPSLWFLDSNGNILDPNDPLNQTVIDHNIQTSFKTAFADNDENGIPDP